MFVFLYYFRMYNATSFEEEKNGKLTLLNAKGKKQNSLMLKFVAVPAKMCSPVGILVS